MLPTPLLHFLQQFLREARPASTMLLMFTVPGYALFEGGVLGHGVL